MMERIVEFWYAIPREKEWWFDQIGRILGGCTMGCVTFLLFWFLSTLFTTAISWFFARNFNENVSMGLAWGCPLGLTTALVGGSLVLSLIARYQEG